MKDANFAKLIPLSIQLTKPYPSGNHLEKKISITHSSGIKFISLTDIVFLQANGSYTIVVLQNGDKMTASKPMSRFEQKLESPWFFRIHKSYILNIMHLCEYCSREGDFAIMNTGERLLISRQKLGDFLQHVETLTKCIRI